MTVLVGPSELRAISKVLILPQSGHKVGENVINARGNESKVNISAGKALLESQLMRAPPLYRTLQGLRTHRVKCKKGLNLMRQKLE